MPAISDQDMNVTLAEETKVRKCAGHTHRVCRSFRDCAGHTENVCSMQCVQVTQGIHRLHGECSGHKEIVQVTWKMYRSHEEYTQSVCHRSCNCFLVHITFYV